MHHGGERGDGKNIAGDFDGAFFGGALDFLDALRMRHRADVPDIAQNGAGVGNEQSRKARDSKPRRGRWLLRKFRGNPRRKKRDAEERRPARVPCGRSAGSAARNCKKDARGEMTRQIDG